MIRRDKSPYTPIHGTRPAPQGMFVKTWGTLLCLPSHGHARGAQDVRFTPGALDALFHASEAGWNVYLVGNEPAVARGAVSEAAWTEIQAAIRSGLSGAGVRLARSYVCTTDPAGRGRHQGESVYQLPNTGAFFNATHADGVELRRSWCIGDSTVELVAAWRAGVRLAGVKTGLALRDRTYEVEPECVETNLARVIGILLETQTAVVR